MTQDLGHAPSNLPLPSATNTARSLTSSDWLLIVTNAWIAFVLAAGGSALFFGQSVLRWWQNTHIVWTLLVLPYPDIFFRFLPSHPNLAMSYRVFGTLDFFLAALAGALAYGIYRRGRWAYFVETLVCLAALVGRAWQLETSLTALLAGRPNAFLPGNSWYEPVYFVGVIPAVLLGLYSYREAHPSGIGISGVPAQSQATGVSREDWPTALTVAAVVAGISYVLIGTTAAQKSDYWPRRYLLFKLALVIIGYAAVVLIALLSRTRRYAPSVGFGLSLTSPVALLLSLGPGIHHWDPALFLVIGLVASIVHPNAFAVVMWVFLFGNLALLIASVKRRSPLHVPVILLSAAFMFSTLPGIEGFKDYEASRIGKAQALSNSVAPVLYKIDGCLIQFRHSAESYPKALTDLDSSMPGCLPRGLASGRVVGGYRYSYEAAKTTPITQFSLVARPAMSVGKVRISFYSDENAIIRSRQEDPLADATDYALTPVRTLWSLLYRINSYTTERDRIAQRNAPPRLYNADELHYPDSLADAQMFGFLQLKSTPDPAVWQTTAYQVTYHKLPGEPENFELTARPNEYGVTGIRSYFANNTLVVHATVEDRPATLGDPEGFPCESSPYTQCANARADYHFTPANVFTAAAAKSGDAIINPEFAKSAKPQVFWRIKDQALPLLGVSDDLQQIYVRESEWSFAAIQRDGRPLWGYSRAGRLIVAPDALYALDRDLLSRLDANGQVSWTLGVDDKIDLTRSGNGVLFVTGFAYLRAVSPDGQQLWRMQLPDSSGAHDPVLSADGKTLYLATNRNLYAIDSQRGHLMWTAENGCDTTYFRCVPQAMADGSLAIKAANIDTREFRLRIFDTAGNEVSARDMGADFQYLVPAGTSVVITWRNRQLEASGRKNKVFWTETGSWSQLSRSRRPGYFYACNQGTLHLMGADGESHFSVSESSELKDICSATLEGPEEVLFIRQYNESTHVQTLWTARLPDFAAAP
jgi:outer membrane protein assembly factor BamB